MMKKKIILFSVVCSYAFLMLGQVVRTGAESCIGGNCNPPKPITPSAIAGDIIGKTKSAIFQNEKYIFCGFRALSPLFV